MRLTHSVLPLFALSLALSCPTSVRAAAQQGPPPPGYGYGQGGWDAPPAEFREAQRQGFHDGIEGAKRDFENHRRPDPDNRDEFRHPHVRRSLRADYREGFRAGYERAMQHLMGRHDHDHGPY